MDSGLAKVDALGAFGLQLLSPQPILLSQQEPLREIILSSNVGQTPISSLEEIIEFLVIQT